MAHRNESAGDEGGSPDAPDSPAPEMEALRDTLAHMRRAAEAGAWAIARGKSGDEVSKDAMTDVIEGRLGVYFLALKYVEQLQMCANDNERLDIRMKLAAELAVTATGDTAAARASPASSSAATFEDGDGGMRSSAETPTYANAARTRSDGAGRRGGERAAQRGGTQLPQPEVASDSEDTLLEWWEVSVVVFKRPALATDLDRVRAYMSEWGTVSRVNKSRSQRRPNDMIVQFRDRDAALKAVKWHRLHSEFGWGLRMAGPSSDRRFVFRVRGQSRNASSLTARGLSQWLNQQVGARVVKRVYFTGWHTFEVALEAGSRPRHTFLRRFVDLVQSKRQPLCRLRGYDYFFEVVTSTSTRGGDTRSPPSGSTSSPAGSADGVDQRPPGHRGSAEQETSSCGSADQEASPSHGSTPGQGNQASDHRAGRGAATGQTNSSSGGPASGQDRQSTTLNGDGSADGGEQSPASQASGQGQRTTTGAESEADDGSSTEDPDAPLPQRQQRRRGKGKGKGKDLTERSDKRGRQSEQSGAGNRRLTEGGPSALDLSLVPGQASTDSGAHRDKRSRTSDLTGAGDLQLTERGSSAFDPHQSPCHLD